MIITQDMINKLHQGTEERRKNKEAVYDRLLHNRLVEALIRDLTQEVE